MCKQVSSLFPLYSLISLIPFHSHPGNERNYREGAGYQPPRAYVSKAREWANSPGKHRTRAAAGENWRWEKHPAFFQNPQETHHSGSREAQKNLCWHVSEAQTCDLWGMLRAVKFSVYLLKAKIQIPCSPTARVHQCLSERSFSRDRRGILHRQFSSCLCLLLDAT